MLHAGPPKSPIDVRGMFKRAAASGSQDGDAAASAEAESNGNAAVEQSEPSSSEQPSHTDEKPAAEVVEGVPEMCALPWSASHLSANVDQSKGTVRGLNASAWVVKCS